jgi:hypothetical protein
LALRSRCHSRRTIGLTKMSDFDPAELEKIIRENRVKPTTSIIGRLDHVTGYLHSLSTGQDRLNERAERSASWTQGVANQLAAIRGILIVIMVCAIAVTWKVVFAS